MSIYKNRKREEPTAEVIALGKMEFKGDIIPHTWKDYIRKANKRSIEGTVVDLEACVILARIVFWYRPADIVNEKTLQVIGWKKKFWGDKLQASYDQLSESTGLTKRQVKDAVDRLEDGGYITREFRHSRKACNVLYIGINVDEIERISYPYHAIA